MNLSVGVRKEVSQRANRVQGRRAGGAYHAARGRQDQGVFDSRQRHAALPKLGGRQTVRTADGPRRPWRFPVGVEGPASILFLVAAALFHDLPQLCGSRNDGPSMVTVWQ